MWRHVSSSIFEELGTRTTWLNTQHVGYKITGFSIVSALRIFFKYFFAFLRGPLLNDSIDLQPYGNKKVQGTLLSFSTSFKTPQNFIKKLLRVNTWEAMFIKETWVVFHDPEWPCITEQWLTCCGLTRAMTTRRTTVRGVGTCFSSTRRDRHHLGTITQPSASSSPRTNSPVSSGDTRSSSTGSDCSRFALNSTTFTPNTQKCSCIVPLKTQLTNINDNYELLGWNTLLVK